MDAYSLAVSSVILFQILNPAHSIDRIEFIYVGGERVRVDYGVPRHWGEREDSNYCGFANYQYEPLIFVNTACKGWTQEQILQHETEHIKEYQWYHHPAANEIRRPYAEHLLQFEIEAYNTMNKGKA